MRRRGPPVWLRRKMITPWRDAQRANWRRLRRLAAVLAAAAALAIAAAAACP